ncbi:MAG: galactokinase [Spirochaetales bacterium]|nr:MAG: galactokinase [Spirochaetales bacterium]
MTANTSRKQRMVDTFKKLYGKEPDSWVRAPGRGELIGTDTDDNYGYVLTMAIHLDTWIAFSKSGDDKAKIYSLNMNEQTEFPLRGDYGSVEKKWDRYVNGVAEILSGEGYKLAGVNAVIDGAIPIGGGLSSSASLEAACSLMFQSAGGFSLDPKETALYCQQAENRCVGVMCGILDQYTSIFGRTGSALLLDCRSLTHILVKIPSDLSVVICDTNVPHTLVSSEYGNRRKECEEAARILSGINPEIVNLRDVNPKMFEAMKGALPDVNRKRARFIVEENQRVMDFTAAMVRDDRPVMRKLCEGSFAGMRDLYEKTVPEMERMFESMMSAPGIVCARQSGGGFGGCMISLVEKNKVEAYADHIKKSYKEKTGIETSIYVTQPSDGAGELSI